jgi:hypothetical protein
MLLIPVLLRTTHRFYDEERGPEVMCKRRAFTASQRASVLTCAALPTPKGDTMNSHPPGFEDLEERLLKLEEQNRRFKQFGAVVLAVAAVIVVMGQAPAKKTVEANEFILRDDSGNVRARLFVTTKSTTSMKELFGVGDSTPVTFPPRATLALYDENGHANGLLDDDSISFIKSHVLLGNGSLAMGDQTSGLVISRYGVGLVDEQGFEAHLGRSALTTPQTGGTETTSAASLVLFDKDKKVIWKAP